MTKIKEYTTAVALIPLAKHEGPTGKVFAWIEQQIILLMVLIGLIFGGLILTALYILQKVFDFIVSKIINLFKIKQPTGHHALEPDPTHLELPHINLN